MYLIIRCVPFCPRFGNAASAIPDGRFCDQIQGFMLRGFHQGFLSYLGQYAAYLADIKQLLPVRLLHLVGGLSNPLIDCRILDSVILGIKRCNGKEPDRKLPITLHITLRMHRLINKDSPFHMVFWAICFVLIFGMLRKSNVLPPPFAFNPIKHLCRSDFLITLGALRLISGGQKQYDFAIGFGDNTDLLWWK